MPNPDPQRPTFHGKPGRSGRKSLKDELAAHHIAQEIFFKKWDFEEIDKLVAKLQARKGRISVREMMILKALGGNEKMIIAVWDKIAPTKLQHSGAVPVSSVLDEEEPDHEQPHSTSSAGADGTTPPDHREQTGEASTVPTQPDSAPVQPPTD